MKKQYKMKTKEEIIERWGRALESSDRLIQIGISKLQTSDVKHKANYARNIAIEYAFAAELEYLINDNIDLFKEYFIKATKYEIKIFEMFETRSAPVGISVITMTRYRQLLNALASGDLDIATKLANYMGGRIEIETKYDNDFILSLGYSIKYAVENNGDGLKIWIEKLIEACNEPKGKHKVFMGYPLVLEALLERDLEKANAAFVELIAGHKQKCTKRMAPDYGPYFYDSTNAEIFVSGIGLANLCRHYGLDVSIDDPIMPNGLIIPTNSKVIPVEYGKEFVAVPERKRRSRK